ncbi:MAG: nucleotidyltransferase [Schaedlerella sp.]|nr:nucleotidyltransferase [Schaedlerella sp.]
MKIVGLITEYNPFHNGHYYHIQKAKQITSADYAVIIMSGDFVQRGTPAIIPKRLRAQMALHCGADAVFELPVCYSTGSAEFFAEGTISFLDQLGIVDFLCFGSESNNLPGLQSIADVLLEEPEDYRIILQSYLKSGLSFPAARQKSLTDYFQDESLSSLLNDPNNILGIEYLKALKKFKSKIQPFTIRREGAHYHEEKLIEGYSSASAIRRLLAGHTDFSSIADELENQVPTACFQLLKENYNTLYPVFPNDFSLLLKYRLLEENSGTVIQYMDVSEELANRIYNKLPEYLNFEQFCNLLKTRELTYTRVQRALLHIMLKIRTEEIEFYRNNQYHFYARLLGFQKEAVKIISTITKTSSLPLITKPSDANRLDETGQKMLDKDLFVSNLYASAIANKYQKITKNEYQSSLIKIKRGYQ